MNIKLSKSVKAVYTLEQIENAIIAKGIFTEKFSKFNAVRISGDALDTATGKGLHAAALSNQKREIIINAYPVNGSDYIVIRLTI